MKRKSTYWIFTKKLFVYRNNMNWQNVTKLCEYSGGRTDVHDEYLNSRLSVFSDEFFQRNQEAIQVNQRFATKEFDVRIPQVSKTALDEMGLPVTGGTIL
ncbi:hypothetical protein AVEN_265406-1 [Araneus ventricosus]|uniref:Uncharacterized protein n=1 Tax=Araneus ventricosus TaxID=182803 RepID=A0A4Y2P4L0_ARAVE|nr:hypothetical protein AVEN_265406-1 [Araneus ventricosus]